MNKLPIFIVDVFADKKYEGNQLAVIIDLEKSLSPAMMQKIALEMNFSETTFIRSKKKEDEGYKVRIFTPKEELPFAGHPTLGTAYIINKVFEIDEEKLSIYEGNYDEYIQGKNKWIKSRETEFKLQELRRTKLESLISKAKKLRDGKRRGKALKAARKRMDREVLANDNR